MTALTTSGAESTSPMPTMPSSVWTRIDEVVLAAIGNGAIDDRLTKDDRFDFGDLQLQPPESDGFRPLWRYAKMSATRSPVATAQCPVQLTGGNVMT